MAARRLGIAVPVVVLNDGWLGLMKVKQERKGYPLSGVRLGEPPPSPAHYFGVPCRPAHTVGRGIAERVSPAEHRSEALAPQRLVYLVFPQVEAVVGTRSGVQPLFTKLATAGWYTAGTWLMLRFQPR